MTKGTIIGETKFMGVLNVTPDSFSDGGRFGSLDELARVARQMVLDGAMILDIGGESSGPGSKDVSLEEELARVVPAVWKVREELDDMGAGGVMISVDTWKSEVAEAAIAAGANMINDVTAGCGDERIFEVVARSGQNGLRAFLCLMYSKDDTARTTQDVPDYEKFEGGVMGRVKEFLMKRVEVVRKYGVDDDRIILDPGMGAFVSGDAEPSYEIIDRIEELCELGFPVLVGTSRKSFLCEGQPDSQARLDATLASTVWLRGRVDYLRVHDVLENMTVKG